MPSRLITAGSAIAEVMESVVIARRPEVADFEEMRGPRFAEAATGCASVHGWTADATNHVIFGGSGHISFEEARRFGAALIAIADAHDAGELDEQVADV